MTNELYLLGTGLSFVLFLRLAKIVGFPPEAIMLLVLASVLWPFTFPIACGMFYLREE